MIFSYISNNCLAQELYFAESREYDSPFIGSLFVNDMQFVKLCLNYDYYINIEPIFGLPKEDSIWAVQNKGVWYNHPEIIPPYPVMFIDDIEIHWIHEIDINILLDKYRRRINRYKEKKIIPFFILCVSDLCNDHNQIEYKNMLIEFTSIKNSIYLTKYEKDLEIKKDNIFLIKEWINMTEERGVNHIYKFHNISNRSIYVKDIIKNIK
jgi:uncharacterized protein (DUF1919 family)